MSELFLILVNMSISASWLVLAVLLLRLFLTKAPKWTKVLLWGLVGIRLVLPFSIESVFSLIPSAETIPPTIMTDQTPSIHSGISALNSAVNPMLEESFTPNPTYSANPLQIWIPVLAVLWIVGIGTLIEYSLFSYLRLRRRVAAAVLLREHIYQCEAVASPFVLGIINPRIYVPFHLEEQTLSYVIAHEQAHIRRRDHLWKPLGFFFLTVYWFNPLLWIAYILLCKDIELACDEKVIKELEDTEKADYAQTLLDYSINRRMIAACPLAFGEVSVKERVKSVLNYKKPAFWIILVAVVSCIVVAVCFLTNPDDSRSSKSSKLPYDVHTWFDYYHSETMPWDSVQVIKLDAFPDVTFRWDSENVEAIVGNETTKLYGGMPVWSVFFSDITGDGLPDLCSNASFGSGIIDDRIIVYDYANKKRYELSARGVYDYILSEKNGQLVVTKKAYDMSKYAGVFQTTLTKDARLVLVDDKLTLSVTSGEIESPVKLERGSIYVSSECLYMNPLSSYYPLGGDSGFRYRIGKDYFDIIARQSITVKSDANETDYLLNANTNRMEDIKWKWQEFPYTDEEWTELFKFSLNNDFKIREQYKELFYQPINDKYFLLSADGTLLLVELHTDNQAGTYIWSIYSLVTEASLGSAQWEYLPQFSSRSPVFQFDFAMDYTEIQAFCTNGTLTEFNYGENKSATELTIPAGKPLCWSPREEEISQATGTEITFFVYDNDTVLYSGKLYITSEEREMRQTYAATIGCTGLYLSQDSEQGGAIISVMGNTQ